jgi:two-component system, chemotaxis family, protein-glutamate methylesterase/glutaminase
VIVKQGKSLPAHGDKGPNSNGPSFLVAMAASAGGLNALSVVLSSLSSDFPAPIVVVQHMSRQHPSMLADILNRRTAIRVKAVTEGEIVQPGTVYIAQPDSHLRVTSNGTLSMSHEDLVHFVRPSADLLFSSVAESYGSRAIAVVLSGTGSDGATGAIAVHDVGGTVIAQDQTTAEFAGMPNAVIKTGSVDFILPLEEIAARLIELVSMGETGDVR